jgi:hypothetical protein
MTVLINHRINKHTLNRCARYLKCSWHTAKRALTSAMGLINWLLNESTAVPLAPCREHNWPAFTRAYSYAFFPDRR